MKKTRRGGLGRGLGALIQSTADTEETPQAASSSAASGSAAEAGKSGDAKASTPRRRTTSAAAAASEKAADKTPAKTSSSSAGSEKPAASRSTSKSSTSAASKKSSSATSQGTASKGKATSKTSKTTARTSKDTPASSSESKSKASSQASSSGTKTTGTRGASKSTAQGKGGSAQPKKGTARSGARPVDVFFSSERSTAEDEKASHEDKASGSSAKASAQDQKDQKAASSRQGARKSSARRSRPSMPAVSAPSRRSAPTPTDAEKAEQKPAEGPSSSPASNHSSSTPSAAEDSAQTEATGTVSTDIAVLRELKVTDIHPNPRQPREVFDEDHMDELVTSITEVGILQPVVVREVDGPTPYELIMGERRWRATQLAGLDTIPAIVRHTPDEDLLRDALLENLHRSQLNPLEEAAAYQQLMDDFQCTQEELSQRIGRSRPQISNTLRLMKLPPLVQRRVANNTLTAGHARALLGLTDPAEMERLAQRIVSEGLSVRATEEAVALAQGVRQAAPATRRRSEPTRHERLDYFATALTSRLDTQVKITLGKRKGKIAIDFASVEDLNRIMELIQGDDAQK